MSYIGSPPKQSFTSGLLDRFTSTTGTTVTLTHDIASENDIVVFVNFVKQDSTTYSVGGTGNKTLTLGGTLVSSDIVEVHYLNIVGQTVNPSANSVGSSQLTADSITGQTALAVAPDSTDELLISDGGTLKRIDVSLVGGVNKNLWLAYNNSADTISNATWTKVEMDVEVYDTASAFDVSNDRFVVPSGEGGYYYIYGTTNGRNTNNHLRSIQTGFYKNGSRISNKYDMASINNADSGDGNFRGFSRSHSLIVNLSAGDYVEMYTNITVSSGSAIVDEVSIFGGYKLLT
jgi:hypothetical protein